MRYTKTAVKKEMMFMGLFTSLSCLSIMVVSTLLFHETFKYFSFALLCAGTTGGYAITKSSSFRATTRGKLWMVGSAVLALGVITIQYYVL